MKLHILGTRGSMPTGGKEYSVFGTDTSCYLVTSDTQAVFLDAGTGICNDVDIGNRDVSIIISHWHLDHIMGLVFMPLLSQNRNIKIFADTPQTSIKSMFERLFSEPFWPCTLEGYPATITYHSLTNQMKIGDIDITTVDGFHPGGCKMIKLSNKGKSICYAGDFEHGENANKALKSFAKDCDILIYDGQYTEEEYEKYKGYGHSTKDKGIEIFSDINCGEIIFTHHNPGHTDEFLSSEQVRLKNINPNATIAKPKAVVCL